MLRFEFDDAHVDFEYADSETEFETPYRGRWTWRSDGEVVDSGEPRGDIPYELMAEELRHAVELGNTPMDEEKIRAMYEPVWSFNEHVDLDDPVEDEDAIQGFVDDAVEATRRGVVS